MRSAVTRVSAPVLNLRNKRGGEKEMVNRRRFLKIYLLKFCDIWQNFYCYRIVNNDKFKMEVELQNFVTHLIITVQLYLKIFSINLLILIFCTLTTEIPCTPDQKLFNGILQLILYNAIAHRF